MKTMLGYKLFEENPKGELFPLFIGKNTLIPIGEWIPAQFIPTKGFASRGGWHIGELPDAPWLKGYDGTEKGCYKSRWKMGKRVWCLVEYNATIDYNNVVEKLPKRCFSDSIPNNGFYFFKEAGKGVWSITSDIKVIRKISEEERQKILKTVNYSEEQAYSKYKQAFEKRLKIA